MMTFATLVFIHFLVDWIFQTHHEAMHKHDHPGIRAWHCFVYTAGFLPYMLFCGWGGWPVLVGCWWLFWTHFVEDTYVPVYWWAYYIRRVPEVRDGRFREWIETPLGKILMIAVDQIIHITCLWVLIWLGVYA